MLQVEDAAIFEVLEPAEIRVVEHEPLTIPSLPCEVAMEERLGGNHVFTWEGVDNFDRKR